jgi:CheY-like chemotaxis protein
LTERFPQADVEVAYAEHFARDSLERRDGELVTHYRSPNQLCGLYKALARWVPLHTDAPPDGAPAGVVPRTPVRKPPQRPVRILVVDDDPDAAQVLAETLRHVGHDVRVAHDGPEALAIAAGFEATTALVDIGLPVMDGYELAERLRELWRPRRVRLLAITGYGQEADRARSQAAGSTSIS